MKKLAEFLVLCLIVCIIGFLTHKSFQEPIEYDLLCKRVYEIQSKHNIVLECTEVSN